MASIEAYLIEVNKKRRLLRIGSFSLGSFQVMKTKLLLYNTLLPFGGLNKAFFDKRGSAQFLLTLLVQADDTD